MKVKLICAVAVVILLQSAVSAQETVTIETLGSEYSCRNFPMPVVGLPLSPEFPMLGRNSFPTVKPDSGVDYKLIIINPCLPTPTQSLTPSTKSVPNLEKEKLPQTPPELELNKNKLKPAQNSDANGQNLVSSQPK
ncbi:MAG: hypothetical protein H7Z37_09575 [Pyrinomonadaceae bacterium]|nr:hypothetical protein [Pyrinomonadaceae bacterium]